jgi:hypothetical protein
MDLFSVTCTTCKSRLKVRDEAAIGQILACPKCGGMVMIKPPPSWSDGGSEAKSEVPTATEVIAVAPPADQTLSSSAFEAVDDLLSDAPPRVTPPAFDAPPVMTGPRPRFVGGPPAAVPSAPASPKSAPAAKPPVEKVDAKATSELPKPKSPSPPPPGEIDFTPLDQAVNVRPWRYWAITAGSIAAGIALAFAAVTIAIHLFREKPQVVAKAPASSTAKSATPDQSTPTSIPEPVQATPDQPTSPPRAPVPDERPKEVAPATGPPPPAVDAAKSTSPVESDPLGLVTASPQAAAPAPSTDSLAKFDRLISGDAPEPTPVQSELPAAPIAEVPVPDTTPAKPVATRPPPREVDVAKRLADPMAGIETPGTPLADFLQVISDYSTMPITLQPDALPLVRISADTPIAFKAANTTVGASLAEALRPLKLEYVAVDDQLIVRLAEPRPYAVIEVQARDLAGDESQLSELAELLKALIEPASWGESAEAGSMEIDSAKNALRVRNSRAVQAQVLLACDRLRVARGKSPVLKLDPGIFQLDTRFARALGPLETPISLNFRQSARLLTVLDHMGKAAGVRILVDWQDAATAGWNPAAEARLVADKQPLASALDALLDPLDLTWRIVDGRTLQVVTPQRLAERIELELYKVDALVAGAEAAESLVARVRAALGEAAFRDGGGHGELRFDVESKCLLAALPQPKQRELEELLAKLRSDSEGK